MATDNAPHEKLHHGHIVEEGLDVLRGIDLEADEPELIMAYVQVAMGYFMAASEVRQWVTRYNQ